MQCHADISVVVRYDALQLLSTVVCKTMLLLCDVGLPESQPVEQASGINPASRKSRRTLPAMGHRLGRAAEGNAERQQIHHRGN